MAQSLRLSEKWYRRGLWVVALLFASFLSGLGGALVGDLPKVETSLSLEHFMDPAATAQARTRLQQAHQARDEATQALEQARLAHQRAVADNQSASETFKNWLATRQATSRPQQDAELIARTQRLDQLRQSQREAQAQVQRQQQAQLDAQQAASQAQARLAELEQGAQGEWQKATRAQELRVFLYRLALTLPLLIVAVWLFKTQRKSTWWPFVWGFILFALVAFFVELVPYLPSYGGYVRYAVGIVLTVVVGRQGILAMNRYLAAQRLAESQPDMRRRNEMDDDVALARLAKNVCPGCERPADLKNPVADFCGHCGLAWFRRCAHCSTRKSAFARYCHSCGEPAKPAADPG